MKQLEQYFSPLERQPLSTQVAERIELMIMERGMAAGEKLPPERELARLFGVNEATIGVALNMLVQRGLVRRRVGSGTFVENRHDQVVAESLRRFCEFHLCTHEHLMEVRLILEPAAAASAARLRLPGEVDALQQITAQMETYFENDKPEAYVEADTQFHLRIAEMSRNPLLHAMINGLHGRMKQWIRELCDKTLHKRGMRTHRQICQAIMDKDETAASLAMVRHLQTARAAMHQIHAKVTE